MLLKFHTTPVPDVGKVCGGISTWPLTEHVYLPKGGNAFAAV